jgi:hypothetical protein
VVQLPPPGRRVSLHEPHGGGRIALQEESIRIRGAVQGEQSPHLIPQLMGLGQLLSHHHDVLEAKAVFERCATLAAATLGEAHATTRQVREQARGAAQSLANVLSRVRVPSTQRVEELSRQALQRATMALLEAGAMSLESATPAQRLTQQRLPGESKAAFEKRLSAECLARAKRAGDVAERRDPPCAGCDAVRAHNAPPFKRCAACNAVAYCGVPCQHAHWKRVHKRECSTLRGAAAPPGTAAGVGAAGGAAAR